MKKMTNAELNEAQEAEYQKWRSIDGVGFDLEEEMRDQFYDEFWKGVFDED